MALGASSGAVVALVLRKGMALAAAGVWLGIFGAALGTRALSGALFGIRPTDALTYALVASGLLLVALVACYLPARRASRVAPQLALKTD